MNRPREITAAGVVALIGSLLMICFGALLGLFGYSVAVWRERNYPGMTYHDPAILVLKSILIDAILISIVLGLIGIVTAFGLFRMRRWARLSTIAWCVVSPLALVFLLVYPRPGSEFRLNPVFPLMLMLVIFPANTWWLLLFFRNSTKAQFGILPAAPDARRVDMKRSLSPMWIMAAVLLVMLGGAVARAIWQASPMREIERSKEAVAAAKSWHNQTVRYFSNLPPETDDEDLFCPVFIHRIAKTTSADGSPLVREGISYFGQNYNYVEGQWVVSPGRPAQSQGVGYILECQQGPVGSDENAVPYDAIISDGTVRRGDAREVDDGPCRDYDIVFPTPHDPAEKEILFSMCINERDHLPREIRRIPPGSDREQVSAYTQWNAFAEPPLPAGFPR